MIRRSIFLLLTIALAAAALSAQQVDPAARAERWKQFNRNNFDKLNFSTVKLTKAKIAGLKEDENADDFALLRGVIFGKRGRIFKERSIQEYLEKQAWYKANKNFSNSILTPGERANLDFIRLAEAQKHPSIEPGDMRIWKSKPIADDNLREYTGAELTILIAEIEAIHGKPFQEDWLQKYFDDRYWYKKNAAYNPSVLNEFERKNIERLNAEKEKGRHTAVSIGDMDNFQNTLLTEDKLAGLSLLDLRILREEFYARHGKKFDAPGVRDYFNWRDWYKEARDQKSVRLNKIEQQNVDLLTAFETKQRERLSTETVTDEALGALFAEDLRLLRNEIYARHGRVFKDKDLQKYFDSQAWYKPNADFKDDQLSEIETANLTKLKQAEESATSKFSEAEG
ncbi:MAG: YARHG domain-containing protein [Acidobacteriota bacterium]